MLDHAEILGIKDISSSLIFKNRHIFSRSCLFHNGVFPPAGMCAGSLIGISSHQIIAQKTSSGIRNAHSPMHKCLNLHIIRNMGTDLPDFLQRKLSCSHHSLRSQLIPETIRFIIGIIGLGTDMALNFRTDFSGISKNSRICDNEPVRLQFLQLFQIFPDTCEIIVMCQNIHSHINLHSMLMGKCNSLCHILMGKILCLCTESKSFPADIYSICPKDHSNL